MLGGAFFGAKVAHADLHVMLNPVDLSVNVVNGVFMAVHDTLVIEAAIVSLNGTTVYRAGAHVSFVAADAVLTSLLRVPRTVLANETRFVSLTITASTGTVIDRNVYWLSRESQQDVFDYSRAGFAPLKSYADFSALLKLPLPSVHVGAMSMRCPSGADTCVATVLVTAGQEIAFFLRFRLVDSLSGVDVLPAMWSANFVTLFPKQSTSVTVTFPQAAQHTAKFMVEPFAQFVGK